MNPVSNPLWPFIETEFAKGMVKIAEAGQNAIFQQVRVLMGWMGVGSIIRSSNSKPSPLVLALQSLTLFLLQGWVPFGGGGAEQTWFQLKPSWTRASKTIPHHGNNPFFFHWLLIHRLIGALGVSAAQHASLGALSNGPGTRRKGWEFGGRDGRIAPAEGILPGAVLRQICWKITWEHPRDVRKGFIPV